AIAGIGTHTLTIAGGAPLGGAVHGVMPDRIELGTLACAAAITDGELLLQEGRLDLLGAAAPLLAAAGVELRAVAGGLRARRSATGLAGVDVVTQPHPGFATDLQAPAMALLATADGASTITETIFEQRFWHVDELRKMGANIAVRHQTAVVRGVPRLRGAAITGADVRAAAALVIAALGADGETVLDGLHHLDRGYDHMAEKLVACGADVRRSAR
ncbi:MAG: UDP-N-acetylglucosamine 1-carboxyvinyltransferase, partial [Alphaproteobacteria bacterium]|nr:UDP-N-acetylglucosamine 1-carboxyvinyltransferase [Alphaproteobacteria bacterium]